MCKDEEKKKALRQFSRTGKKSKLRRCSQQEAGNKLENSDASSNTAEMLMMMGEDEGAIRRSSRKKVVDLQQLSQYINFLEDEELLEAEEEPKAKVARRSKPEPAKKPGDKQDLIEECLSFLENIGLFKLETPQSSTPPGASASGALSSPGALHPGSVGRGKERCKVCGRREDSSSLICDVCEEIVHVSCCYPRIRSIPRDDRWLCGFCTRKRKKKSAELKIFPAGHFDEKLPSAWKLDKTKLRGWDLEQMGRTQVRIGSRYQAEVPEWSGSIDEELRHNYPGLEDPCTEFEKQQEKERAEFNVAQNIWPMGWLPAKSLPEGERENWIQCQNIMHEEGDHLPDGSVASRDIVCGKWRRAPLHVVADDGWECSCAIAWDPRHADCAVKQELPAEEIRKRPGVRMQSPEEWRNSGRRRGQHSMADS